jgi:hypothetical protein
MTSQGIETPHLYPQPSASPRIKPIALNTSLRYLTIAATTSGLPVRLSQKSLFWRMPWPTGYVHQRSSGSRTLLKLAFMCVGELREGLPIQGLEAAGKIVQRIVMALKMSRPLRSIW